MIEQHDVDELLGELERARHLLLTDRSALRSRIGNILERSATLRQKATGSPFEESVTCVDNLLQSLQAGLTAQDDLARTQAAA